MNRSHLLFGIVGVVCVVAIGLRVRAYINRPNVELREPGSDPAHATLGSADLPPRPRDYVTDPWIHPDELTAGPKRIVTLAPNVTEIICALGLRDRIVGRSSFSKYPPGIQGIPSVGSLTDANLAKIKAMEPEIILLAANSGPLLGKLEQLQLPFEALPHESLADVYEAIHLAGGLCNRSRTAEHLVAGIRSDIEGIQKWVDQADIPPKRVLLVFGEMPVSPRAIFVAGPGIFFDALIEMAGHENAATQVLHSPHGEIPLEKLRVVNPDVILEFPTPRNQSNAKRMKDLYSEWTAVGDLKAIRQQTIRAIGGPEWLSAGPRIALALYRYVEVLSVGATPASLDHY